MVIAFGHLETLDFIEIRHELTPVFFIKMIAANNMLSANISSDTFFYITFVFRTVLKNDYYAVSGFLLNLVHF